MIADMSEEMDESVSCLKCSWDGTYEDLVFIDADKDNGGGGYDWLLACPVCEEDEWLDDMMAEGVDEPCFSCDGIGHWDDGDCSYCEGSGLMSDTLRAEMAMFNNEYFDADCGCFKTAEGKVWGEKLISGWSGSNLGKKKKAEASLVAAKHGYSGPTATKDEQTCIFCGSMKDLHGFGTPMKDGSGHASALFQNICGECVEGYAADTIRSVPLDKYEEVYGMSYEELLESYSNLEVDDYKRCLMAMRKKYDAETFEAEEKCGNCGMTDPIALTYFCDKCNGCEGCCECKEAESFEVEYYVHSPDEFFGPYYNLQDAEDAIVRLEGKGIEILGISRGKDDMMAESFGGEGDIVYSVYLETLDGDTVWGGEYYLEDYNTEKLLLDEAEFDLNYAEPAWRKAIIIKSQVGSGKWSDVKTILFEAESFEAPYAGAGALMGIKGDSALSSFTPSELTESSAIHGDFDQASLNYSGHQNIEVRAEDEDWECPCGSNYLRFYEHFERDGQKDESLDGFFCGNCELSPCGIYQTDSEPCTCDMMEYGKYTWLGERPRTQFPSYLDVEGFKKQEQDRENERIRIVGSKKKLDAIRKGAEGLGKDSCCCGATKSKPCACMKTGAKCSGSCACSTKEAEGRGSPYGESRWTTPTDAGPYQDEPYFTDRAKTTPKWAKPLGLIGGLAAGYISAQMIDNAKE